MYKYPKSKIEELVKSSTSKAQILEKLGLHRNGNNNNMIQKIIDVYDIDITHFDYHRNRTNNINNFVKYKLSDILVENSTYQSSSNLKKRLYKEGLKERKCEKCGQGELWNGEKMSLILDHINGVNNDNRIENLRIVCPNCNATLPTHAGKNAKKEKKRNYCECGVEINKHSKQCKRCYDKHQRNKSKRPSYETLKTELIDNDYLTIAIKYNVSENCIMKWEKQLDIEKQLDSDKKYKEKIIKSRRKVKNRPSYVQLIEEINELGYCGTGRKYGVSDNAIRKWKKNYEKD